MATHSHDDNQFYQNNWPRAGRRMDEEAFHELEQLTPDRRYEYIDGIAYLMSGGSIEHDRIRRNLENALDLLLRSGGCTVFGPDVQVLVGTKKNGRPQYFYPDTTVSCHSADRRRGNMLIEAPRLVIEVLSPGTESRDRGIKFRAYQACETLQEIVLVSQFAPYVEVWRRNAQDPDNPGSWLYSHYRPGDTVELASLHVQIPVATIYQGLSFDEDEDE